MAGGPMVRGTTSRSADGTKGSRRSQGQGSSLVPVPVEQCVRTVEVVEVVIGVDHGRTVFQDPLTDIGPVDGEADQCVVQPRLAGRQPYIIGVHQ